MQDARLDRRRAESVVNQNYTALRPIVTGTITRRAANCKLHCDRSDIDELYNQAWLEAFRYMASGGSVINLQRFLIRVAWFRTIDSWVRGPNTMQVLDPDVGDLPIELDFAKTLDDRQKLKAVMSRARHRLTPRELSAFTLRYIRGYSYLEIAASLELNDSQVEKVMYNLTNKLGSIASSVQTRGCGGTEWQKALRKFARGELDPRDRDRQRISEHTLTCEPCRRYLEAIRKQPDDPDPAG